MCSLIRMAAKIQVSLPRRMVYYPQLIEGCRHCLNPNIDFSLFCSDISVVVQAVVFTQECYAVPTKLAPVHPRSLIFY